MGDHDVIRGIFRNVTKKRYLAGDQDIIMAIFGKVVKKELQQVTMMMECNLDVSVEWFAGHHHLYQEVSSS